MSVRSCHDVLHQFCEPFRYCRHVGRQTSSSVTGQPVLCFDVTEHFVYRKRLFLHALRQHKRRRDFI